MAALSMISRAGIRMVAAGARLQVGQMSTFVTKRLTSNIVLEKQVNQALQYKPKAGKHTQAHHESNTHHDHLDPHKNHQQSHDHTASSSNVTDAWKSTVGSTQHSDHHAVKHIHHESVQTVNSDQHHLGQHSSKSQTEDHAARHRSEHHSSRHEKHHTSHSKHSRPVRRSHRRRGRRRHYYYYYD